MIEVRGEGSFSKIEKLLQTITGGRYLTRVLNRYGELGVRALASATPKDTGETSSRWSYEIEETDSGIAIYWTNDNAPRNVSVAMLLQYGHATRNGGYVEGIDYINPALRPIFDALTDQAWKEVTGT